MLSDLIDNNSTNDSLFVERALLNIEKGNLEEAKKDLQTANLLDTTNGNTCYLLADVLLELAKHGKKIMTFPILKKWALGSQEEINQFLSSPPNIN